MITVDVQKKLRFSEGIKLLDISFEIDNNGFLGITGDSGIGKTTMLRMISGLTEPDRGIIRINNETWYDSDKNINLHANKRSIGYIPQEYNLFPNMTVRENVSYATADKKAVDELLDIVEMTGFEKCYPENLSGGQKQRVALARAIARKPEILLMDEPFSAADCKMKGKLCGAITKIYNEFNVAIFLVSHNKKTVNGLVNDIMVIKNGVEKNYGRMDNDTSRDTGSGIISLEGEVLFVRKMGNRYVATIEVANNLIRTYLSEEDVHGLELKGKKPGYKSEKILNNCMYTVQ